MKAAPPTHTDLHYFHPTLARWFREAFDAPTAAQAQAWPVIARGKSTLLLAPTGSGKTLAAFMVAINRILFDPGEEQERRGVRTLYISPLKALGVDVERNLRAPLAGVQVAAREDGVPHHVPTIGVRSGDTPTAERNRIQRHPPDILITTPESLYLMLTSRAREALRSVDTVIVDEIHSLVATKRGTHLFLSLERLEALRREQHEDVAELQRIGLSATQRPLDEIARLLGGARTTCDGSQDPVPRDVEIVEAGRRRSLSLSIEVPVEDMAQLASSQTNGEPGETAIGSIWPAIHPRLVELIEAHRSTMLFVNSRRLAERLAASINEFAGKELAMAHHGSIAKDLRLQIEDRLKRGELPAIVATSSLELGIDMGAVDLVIQIEAPPTVAAGLQRIGRAGHQVDATSQGVIFPKFRGDLLACAAATEQMLAGHVEATYYPRNPLDVLAQQIVAMVALEPQSVETVYATVRAAAPFSDLPRSAFEGVLDLLSGRYPADGFSELRPRLTWDRIQNRLAPRRGSQRVAILNAGTIPDRGLYGVFLAGDEHPRSRVGELDEEMVFETRPGDVFLLGASSWRALEITHDRVLVTPAPGEPGRMPFWRGDGPGRPLDFGKAIGRLARTLLTLSRSEAEARLQGEHALAPVAAKNLVNYLHDQREATRDVPSDETVVVESFLDEVGDWRVAILTPFGSRVHAPWALAVLSALREELHDDVDMVWTDDGIMFRLPSTDQPPSPSVLVPDADTVEETLTRELGSTALFAARFRENAARALLLPRRNPGKRTPLWVQRRKSADLLQVASQFHNFPILMETYRECLRDVFDLQGLLTILRDIQRNAIRLRHVETQVPSPFTRTLLFTYTANFLYEGDAPLAEQKARSLSLDYAQLKELLGDAQLRELLDPQSVDVVAARLQWLDPRFAVTEEDAIHEMLLKLGDMSSEEVMARVEADCRGLLPGWLESLQTQRRILPVRVAKEVRYVAAEDASRYRDALGAVLPPGLPDAFLEAAADPVGDLVSRYARTHVPFHLEEVAARLGLGLGTVRDTVCRLVRDGRLLEGEFLPGGRGREWCDVDVLRQLKRSSLAQLRKQVEPVTHAALAQFLPHWQDTGGGRRGLDGLLDTIEQLQGVALHASVWEQEVLPARVEGFRPQDLDELCSAGELVWRGVERGNPGDGKVRLYLTDNYAQLALPREPVEASALHAAIREQLQARGACFFKELTAELGGFPHDLLGALWDLVWSGEVTNDTWTPLRALRKQKRKDKPRVSGRRAFRSRRTAALPGSEGRWSLLPAPEDVSPTQRQMAWALQFVARYGILTRELVASEGYPGGFAALYPVLKALEEAGRIRRGYFVSGLGAAQFAAAGAEDRLRAFDPPSRAQGEASPQWLAATDPANPYGSVLSWPSSPASGRPQRTAGARVALHAGKLVAYLGRSGGQLWTFPEETVATGSGTSPALAEALRQLAEAGEVVYLTKVNSEPPEQSALRAFLVETGFVPSAKGFLLRALGS